MDLSESTSEPVHSSQVIITNALSMYLGLALDLSMDTIPVRGTLLRLAFTAKYFSSKLTHLPAKGIYRIVKPYANRKSN